MEVRNRQNTPSQFRSNNNQNQSESFDEDETDELFYRNLKIHICTWNVNTKNPNFKLEELLTFDKDNQPEICVFGFQEINSQPIQRLFDYFYYDPWTNKLTDILKEFNFILIKSCRLVGILLNIYVKRSILPFIKCCSEDWIRLGFWGLWGNKGANICTINIGGLNICFVNSHLSAHEDQDKARIIEHSKIMYHTFNLGNNIETVINQKYLFFFGDLNFRIEDIEINKVNDLIKNNEFNKLIENDQLKKCISKEKCISFFEESEIKFPPTYKFKINTDSYDLSKKDRCPSWCDRILYKINKEDKIFECKPFIYNSIQSFKQSDHKPVYGTYQIRTYDWEKEPPFIIFLDIEANKDQNLDVVYQISKNTVTNSNDWIGIYEPNFKSYNDYKTYVWSARIPELENKKFGSNLNQALEKNFDPINSIEQSYIKTKITIDQSYIKSGFYVLGYFSYVLNNIIGLSNMFEVKLS